MVRGAVKYFLPLVWVATLVFGSTRSQAVEQWTVGTAQRSWEEVGGTSVGVDDTTEVGWIQPVFIVSQNLSLDALDRGGWIVADLYRGTNLLSGIINGNHTIAFPDLSDRNVENREGNLNRDVTLVIDLGATFGVDSLSIYPRQEDDRFMKGYQIWVNDGFDLGDLDPLLPNNAGFFSFVKDWTLVAEEFPASNPFVQAKIPLQFVRYIALSDTISLPDPTLWEIDEFEVWGNGYAATAQFESQVIDLEAKANFGDFIWSAASDAGSAMQIRTRTGQTPDTFIYHRLTGLGLTGETQVSRTDYDKLRSTERGSVQPDTEKWVPWSAPYPATGREPLINAGPARYFQFKIDFLSNSPIARTRVDSLALQFSAPLFGREFLAELTPQIVVPGEPTQFTYAVRAVLDDGDGGIDALEIATPLRPEVKDVRLNGASISFDPEVRDDGFTVRFADDRISAHGTLLEVTFEAAALVYGTRFVGRVFDTRRADDLPQLVRAGNATRAIDTDDLLVKWSLDRSLLAAVELSQALVTPNGDGVNDAVHISYSLLQIIDPIEVLVEIYDLSGRRVWQRVQTQVNGQYAVSWEGVDEAGVVVAPGVYIFRVVAEAATGRHVRIGTVGVVY